MMVADQGGNAHDVVHVGVGDKYRIDGFYDSFSQMGDLATVEEQRSFERPYAQKQERIIQ